jgi:hypothetical protein
VRGATPTGSDISRPAERQQDGRHVDRSWMELSLFGMESKRTRVVGYIRVAPSSRPTAG